VKLTRGIFLAVFTSTILALMLSFLPTVELRNVNLNQGISVFKTEDRTITLNQHTVPELMFKQPFHQVLKRIEWQQSILTVDFIMDAERVRTSEVYKDLLQVVRLGLKETSNVKEVLARVYIRSSNDQMNLAIAMIAKREKLQDNMDWNEEKSELIRDQLESMFDLTYKTKWRELQNNNP
jgi:protein-arginine kinase activator protein McsA